MTPKKYLEGKKGKTCSAKKYFCHLKLKNKIANLDFWRLSHFLKLTAPFTKL